MTDLRCRSRRLLLPLLWPWTQNVAQSGGGFKNPQETGDCQLDCHAGGLWRILLNRTETTALDLNTEWTLVSLYEHLDSALENCYHMELTRSQLLSITTP